MSDADRSSVEIKVLLRNLDPGKSSIKHKDRLRRLNKFRNYVTAKPPPEFYDDDYSLLLLGSESPTAMEDEDTSNMSLYGLMRAAGCPSTDHKDALKRSARPAISLLRYLCLEFDAKTNNASQAIMGELNGFAAAFCALNVPQLRMAKFDVHVGKGENESGSRGGSKDDACHLLALLLARHTDADQDTPKPIKLQELLPAPACQAEFETWLGQNVSPDVRRAIKDNSSGAGGVDRSASSFLNAAAAARISMVDEGDEEDGDVLGAFGKSKSSSTSHRKGSIVSTGSAGQGMANPRKSSGGGKANGLAFDPNGKPTRWADTQMASEKQERLGGAIFIEEEREKAIAERKKAEEEKQRLIGRDPLGIRTEQFDLREIDANRSYLIQQLLHQLETEIQTELALATEAGVEKVNWLEAQRQAILTLIESKKTNTAGEGDQEPLVLPSILPTSPDFDPILFLTLAHRDTSYKELFDSTSRLSRKTDTQVERLQSLVRDNFELFIKCSEGIDVFAENDNRSGHDNGKERLNHRFKKLDALAEACSEEARKSFKPLLDNTNEVRKVQSALAVLQRVAPLMQVPGLMRQHIENASFSSVVKAYRKVLVIDKDHSDVDLLRYVRVKAGEAAQDARHDLELILADESSSATSLLDAVRDLGELLELLEQDGDREESSKETKLPSTPRSRGPSGSTTKAGTFTIDRHVICVRDYPPALGCLLLQTTHFRSLVEKTIANAETSTERLFRGEGSDGSSSEIKPDDDRRSSDTVENSSSSQRSRDKRWKYETLDTRVSATARAVSLAKNWLPRLIQIGMATQEAEKRRVARLSRKPSKDSSGATDGDNEDSNVLSASYVFNSMVRPSLMLLVQHSAFCSLGCANQGSKYRLDATFGKASPEKLRTLLQSPLPPTQTAKCALELAELAETIQDANESMFSIRQLDEDGEETKSAYVSPLEGCFNLASEAVTMIERRVCIYSFDACARKCSLSASGSGTFDGDSLLQCVQKLSELTSPDKCTSEVEKGCVLVVQKICEGLTNYVKDRSDAARLRVVAECADALNTTIVDIVREVSYLTNDQSDRLESSLSEIISGLEGEMFDVFLESVKQNIASYASLGLVESDGNSESGTIEEATPFPHYLAGSFLAIVRCRAQVERALREATVRRSEGTTYQFLALQTASDGVVENICHELRAKLNIIPPSKADTYSIHVLFLINTLKKYLSDEILSLAADTKRMLVTKASSGGRKTGNLLGDGPEGLTALENLERLGRVYVMCLGD